MTKFKRLYEEYDWHKPVAAGTCLKLENIDANDWAWQDKIYVHEIRLQEVAVRRINDDEALRMYGNPHEMHDYNYVYVCLVIDRQERTEYISIKDDDMRCLLEASRLEFPPDPIVWMGLRGGPALVK